jgi:hypothetical protein
MTTEKTSKKTPIFSCEKCDFICSKKNEYNRHIITNKHKRLHDTTEKNPINEPKTFNCKCGKIYRHHTSLAKHKHCCKGLNVSDNISNVSFTGINKEEEEEEEEETSGSVSFNENVIITKDMFMAILNDRQEMLKIIKSLSEQQNSNTTNNTTNHNNMITTTTNSNNNTFNMNLFLNEKCKDAMNMKDFVNSIQLNMTDLENVGRLGYVEGMSNILIDNLQKTDVYKRPVHCSDIKRETLYVKDNNQWERDGPDHQKMTNAVLAVEQKNVALVNEWAKANPRCMNSNTRENEKYFKLSKAATDGEKDGNIDKVIRKVAKKVIIEKDA